MASQFQNARQKLKSLFNPAFLARVVPWLASFVAIFMAGMIRSHVNRAGTSEAGPKPYQLISKLQAATVVLKQR